MSVPRVTPESPAARGRRRDLVVLAAVAALLVGVVVAVHRESPRTLVSAHGLLHGAVALRIEQVGVPPDNPFYAGRPLPYYWVFQWLGVQVGGVLGLDPLHAFELCIAAGVVALVAAAGALGGSLFGAPAAGALLAWLVFAGANLQAPLVLGLRWLRGGEAVLADDPTYLWGLVHPVSKQMRLGDPFGMYGPLLPFFLNATARPLALAGLIVVLAALHRAWRRPALATILGVGMAGFVLGALGSLVALAATGALAVAVAVVVLCGDRAARRPAALAIGALGAGVLLAAPTYAHLFGLAGQETAILGDGLRDAAGRVGTIAASAWALVVLALLGLRRAPREARPFLAVACLAAAILSAANVVLRLPSGNEDNFFHAALVLLAVPAAASALGPEAGGRRLAAGRAFAIAALFLPTALLVLATYVGRPPVPIAFREGRLVRTPEDGDLARLYEYLRLETPADAVVVLDPGPPIRAFAGNTAELPAFTGRAIWTDRETHYLVSPNDDAAARQRVAKALPAGEPVSPADEALLTALPGPVFVLPLPAAEAATAQRLEARYGPAVFRAGAIALWRWRPLAVSP